MESRLDSLWVAKMVVRSVMKRAEYLAGKMVGGLGQKKVAWMAATTEICWAGSMETLKAVHSAGNSVAKMDCRMADSMADN